MLSNTDVPDHHPANVKLLVNASRIPGARFLLGMLLRLPAFRLSNFFGKGIFYDLEKFEGEFGDLFIRPLYREQKVLKGQMQLINSWDWAFLDNLAEIHEQISAPVQLIWGRNDVIFPLKLGKQMMADFGGDVELKVIKNSRLYVQEELFLSVKNMCLFRLPFLFFTFFLVAN